MSKGSKQRPGEGYQEAFSRIFGEKKRQQWTPPPIDSVQQQAQDKDSLKPLGAVSNDT